MKEILRYSHDALYTDLISFILSTVGLSVSIWKYRQNPKLRPLFFFFLGYVLLEIVSLLNVATLYYFESTRYIRRYSDFFDTVIEFFAFFFLIRNYIDSDKIKKILNPLMPFFISLIFAYFFYYKTIHIQIDQYFLQIIFTIQASFLSMACILYYIDLYRKEPKLNLTILPSFWVVTGLSFLMVCTLPFSILGLYLVKTNYTLYFQLYSIFNIFYCILFLMIIKAYFCRQTTVNTRIDSVDMPILIE